MIKIEKTDAIIGEMKALLGKERMYRKELYEQLLARGVVKPNSEKEYNNLFEWALSNELIDKARIKNWNKKKGKLPRYFTKKQLIKLFDGIDRPKDGIACFMALMCGLRINEICTLRIRDIDFENHRILVRDGKNTNRSRDNYGKDRYVDFDSAIEGVIKRWLNIIGESSEWFVPSDKSPDMHLRKKSLHERFRAYLKEVGMLQVEYTIRQKLTLRGKKIEKTVKRHTYYFHCFRHTIACIIYDKTGDIYAVNRFLGHNQLDTTTVYAKITEAKMKNTLSTVFASLHYNYHNGEHLPHPETFKSAAVHSQPVVHASASSPLQLLELQYVNGDISENEFLRKKQVLQATELKKVIEIRDKDG